MKTNTTAAQPLIGQVTQEQLTTWKKAYPLGIFAVTKDGRIGYFRQPDFKDYDAYHASTNDEGKSITDGWKSLADLLWLGGCEELITSPQYLGNVVRKVEEAMLGERAELVKL